MMSFSRKIYNGNKFLLRMSTSLAWTLNYSLNKYIHIYELDYEVIEDFLDKIKKLM